MSVDLYLRPGEIIPEDLRLFARVPQAVSGIEYERTAGDDLPGVTDTTARIVGITRETTDPVPAVVDLATASAAYFRAAAESLSGLSDTTARQVTFTRVGLEDLPPTTDTAHLWRDITATAAAAPPDVTGTDGGTPVTAAGTAPQTTGTGQPPSQTGTGRPPAQTASGVNSPYTARGA